MGKACAVPGCTSAYDGSMHSFFRFPNDKDRNEKWHNILSLNKNPTYSHCQTVCGAHFRPNQFTSRNKMRLTKTALPFKPPKSDNHDPSGSNNALLPGTSAMNGKPKLQSDLPIAPAFSYHLKPCVICQNLTNPGNKFLETCQNKLLEICSKYLHSPLFRKETCSLPILCEPCINSAKELKMLTEQLEQIQTWISNVVFQFTLAVSERKKLNFGSSSLSSVPVLPNLTTVILPIPSSTIENIIASETTLNSESLIVPPTIVTETETVLFDEVKVEYLPEAHSTAEISSSIKTPFQSCFEVTDTHSGTKTISSSDFKDPDVCETESDTKTEIILVDQIKVEYLPEDSLLEDENCDITTEDEDATTDPLLVSLPDEINKPSSPTTKGIVFANPEPLENHYGRSKRARLAYDDAKSESDVHLGREPWLNIPFNESSKKGDLKHSNNNYNVGGHIGSSSLLKEAIPNTEDDITRNPERPYNFNNPQRCRFHLGGERKGTRTGCSLCQAPICLEHQHKKILCINCRHTDISKLSPEELEQFGRLHIFSNPQRCRFHIGGKRKTTRTGCNVCLVPVCSDHQQKTILCPSCKDTQTVVSGQSND